MLPCQHEASRVIGRQGEVAVAQRLPSASAGARGSPRGLRLQDDALTDDAGYGSFVRTNSEVPAARQRPPLTKRLRPRHWAALDYVVGAVFGLILFTTIRRGVVRGHREPLRLSCPTARWR